MDTSIASAVVLPDTEDVPQDLVVSQTGTKRRQPSVTEQDGKRRRLSNGGDGSRRDSNAGNAGQEVSTQPRTRALPEAKDRDRGRRLFGAALAGLSRPSGSTTNSQRRRAEADQKQKAKLELQAQEESLRKRERKERLDAQRMKYQRKFDQDSMRIRHANLLHMAQFLQTKTEPRLYYKPWELSVDQEDRVEDQIATAKATVTRELDEFEARCAQEKGQGQDAEDVKRGAAAMQPADGKGSATNGATDDSKPLVPNDQGPKAAHPDGPASEAVNAELAVVDETQLSTHPMHQVTPDMIEDAKEAVDDNGEEVMEAAAEDTVIY